MYKVYFTEDEEYVRRAIVDTTDWESLGFSICGEAGDGETALREVLSIKPDVLITDIKMPKMDGLELSHLVKKELPDIIIIILSGYDEFDFTQQAIRIGVSDYILKPIVPAKLMRVLMHAAELIEQKKDEKKKSRIVQRPSAVLLDEEEEELWKNDRVVDRFAIFNFVKTGDRSEIISFSSQISETIWNAAHGSHLFFTCCLYDFFMTLKDATASVGIDCGLSGASMCSVDEIADCEELESLIRAALTQVISARDDMADSKSQCVTQARLFIEVHHSDPNLSLSVVAEAVNTAPNYLSTLLNRKSGQSFSEFLNQVRIRHAMELLRTTTRSLSSISTAVGYTDPYYFSKTFKKVMGVSPNEFRKMSSV